MLTKDQLREASNKEGNSVEKWYKDNIERRTGFFELRIPLYISCELLNNYCDLKGKPCYRFMRDHLSFHDTYSQLLDVESRR